MSKYNPSLLPQRVIEYTNYLYAVKNSSALTVEGYVRDLRMFFEFLVFDNKGVVLSDAQRDKTDLSHLDDSFFSTVTLGDGFSFLAYCASERNNSVITRKRKISSLRGFFTYISDKMHYIPTNPFSLLQMPNKNNRKLPKYLTLSQSLDLLNAVEGENSVRDYCILTLFLNCGLRLAELVNLNMSSVNLQERTILITGKGNKQRMLYLNDSCVNAITEYLKIRPTNELKGDDRNALFISRLNKRIGRQAVQLMVYHYLDKIGLNGQHYSVHKLRHTSATLMYQHAGVDVMVIKDILGHENVSTTQIYTHVGKKQISDAIDKNPLNKKG